MRGLRRRRVLEVDGQAVRIGRPRLRAFDLID